jgi:hypothetical protein
VAAGIAAVGTVADGVANADASADGVAGEAEDEGDATLGVVDPGRPKPAAVAS